MPHYALFFAGVLDAAAKSDQLSAHKDDKYGDDDEYQLKHHKPYHHDKSYGKDKHEQKDDEYDMDKHHDKDYSKGKYEHKKHYKSADKGYKSDDKYEDHDEVSGQLESVPDGGRLLACHTILGTAAFDW